MKSYVFKHILGFSAGLLFIFPLSACGSATKSLKQAYETIINNDTNAKNAFSISEDFKTIYFFIDSSSGKKEFKQQNLLNLNMFMSMCGFAYEDYLTVKDSFGTDAKGEIKKVYTCEWASTLDESISAVFY